MALIRCDFFSEVLGLSTSMNVLLPQATSSQIGLSATAAEGPPPVLYLLHGLSDDCTTWVRRTSLERYVADRGLAVVMPEVGRSFYVDGRYGNRYGTFLTEELPQLVQQFFQISTRREDTFVAGLSMGGYGAMRWALTNPERFAAAASLSGALDVATLQEQGHRDELYRQIFGTESVRGSDVDLFALLRRADAGPTALPRLYACCGTEDSLLASNDAFRDTAVNAGVELTYATGPGGHDWAYWDMRIQKVLDWLPLQHLDAGGDGPMAGPRS